MSTIVIHAGMPKAGSTTVQRWLGGNAGELREGGFTVLFIPPNESGEVAFEPYEKGSINSGWIIDRGIGRPAAEQDAALEVLLSALDAATEGRRGIVISGESFAHPFWTLHEPTLRGLDRLSGRHRVRIAYYVRPQHAALEAAWRQWGFRSGESPSAFVERRTSQFHHGRTKEGVASLAPGLEFEPLPIDPSFLLTGDLVGDFAKRFLGIDSPPTGERLNRGLPLQVVNVLRMAPVGMFWGTSGDNERLDRIKQLLDRVSLPDDERIVLSRRVLRKFAFERFAAENAELGWEDFVPPPEDPDEIPGIEALDELWSPRASRAELTLILAAVDAAIRD